MSAELRAELEALKRLAEKAMSGSLRVQGRDEPLDPSTVLRLVALAESALDAETALKRCVPIVAAAAQTDSLDAPEFATVWELSRDALTALRRARGEMG